MEAKCPADFEHPVTFLKHTAERQRRLTFHISPRPRRIFHGPLGVRLSPFFPPPQITSFWQTNYDQSLREDAWEWRGQRTEWREQRDQGAWSFSPSCRPTPLPRKQQNTLQKNKGTWMHTHLQCPHCTLTIFSWSQRIASNGLFKATKGCFKGMTDAETSSLAASLHRHRGVCVCVLSSSWISLHI